MIVDLSGKTALVTGGSRGIGRATAMALAKAGAEVIVHFASNAAAAREVVEQIESAGGRAQSVAADLAGPTAPHDLAREVRQRTGNRLDIVVASAGVLASIPFDKMDHEEFDRLFAVNVRAPYFLVQQLLPCLSDGASIILLSSRAASRAVGMISAYAATKGAVQSLTRHLAFALGDRGIRVNAVAPGMVDTDMAEMRTDPNKRDFALNIQVLKRLAQPEDIADFIACLSADQCRWVTGQVIAVDGGTLL
ncbi:MULTISPECIES: SDR family oxidoreductase [Rhodomicrobium]|uniref:SDR family NAD(P)-dependent oxidoreductase n=1 Tax=Rhodomicrobium TaxID=1068 RepID=UPI0014821924|nr:MULTISPECIES: SDR family oxidoreductase [Rhodomicrobium]